MLQIVVVVLEGTSRVVRRVNVDALHLSLVKGQKCFECNEIVSVNDEVVFGLLGITVHGLSFEKMEGNFGGRPPRGVVIDPMK